MVDMKHLNSLQILVAFVRRLIPKLAALPVLVALIIPVSAAETNRSKLSIEDLFAPPKVHLEPVPHIIINPIPAVGGGEAAKIKGLIKNLAKVENPNYGMSPTISGEAFAPIPAAWRMETVLMTEHKLEQFDDFTQLVKLGPKALPFLLDSLDDPTPTKLVIRHDSAFGMMWYANELDGNPNNSAEQKVLAPLPLDRFWKNPGEGVPSYMVKIGDVCFVAIGQIVSRKYESVRYQPTACIVLNSPTHDTNIAALVRAIWSSRDPGQNLFDSLMLDFATRGNLSERGWGVASSLQAGAAMRLLYYYPSETTNMIATRLHRLDIGATNFNYDATNGVEATELIKAVAWSKEPAIKAELQRIFRMTTDPDILRVVVNSMDASESNEVQKRFEEFISNLPETEEGPFGHGYDLLVSMGEQCGNNARPTYEHYMKNASLQRRRSMCRVLDEVHGDWSVALLGPLLVDKRPAEGWTYAVVAGQNDPRLPIRVCDEAADTIARNFPQLKFEMVGQHEDLDRQIQKMREQIAAHDY